MTIAYKPREEVSEETCLSDILILDLPTSKIGKNKSLPFQLPSLWYFVMVVK
jgi:hypothetical protein